MDNLPKFPNWLVVTCCVVPLLSLLIVCIASVLGNQLHASIYFFLVCLCGKVIAHVIGIRAVRTFRLELPRVNAHYSASASETVKENKSVPSL